jgi:T5SS/PEP-CTERM-associated repeat protein
MGQGYLAITNGGAASSESDVFIGYEQLSGGNTLVATNSSLSAVNNLYVGNAGIGRLTINTAGTVSNTDGYLGYLPFGDGMAYIDGEGSSWENSGVLSVGYEGNGYMEIENGAAVESLRGIIGSQSTGEGEAYIRGGSTWNNETGLYVGHHGEGTMFVNSRGAVTNTGGFIGSEAGSTGTVRVVGSGSTWTNSANLTVGGSGDGLLEIERGGAVTNVNATLGRDAGSVGIVNVDGADSSWISSGTVIEGLDGHGEINVTGGATVSPPPVMAPVSSANNQVVSSSVASSNVYMGYNRGGSGIIRVDGNGSKWANSGNLVVGLSGSGSLQVTNGGAFSNKNGYLGYNSGSRGSATISGAGSSWTNSGNLYVGGNASSGGGYGVLNITSGGLVTVANTLVLYDKGMVNINNGILQADTIDTSKGGTAFNFNGGTLAVNSFTGDLVNNSGTLAVATSNTAGITSVNGNYTQGSKATLEVEIGGLIAGLEYDVFDVDGIASLAGLLDVDLLDLGGGMFSPSLGDSFDILTAETINGQFDFLSLATLSSGLRWNIEYLIDEINTTDVVRLTVTSVPVPAAVWLFGSGLLGLFVATRRKQEIA